MQNIDEKISQLKSYLELQDNILAVWLIGSYGTDYQHESSDIDFAVLCADAISVLDELNIADAFTSILGVEDVDIVNLQKAPITLQFRSIKEGRPIFERDFIKVSNYIEEVLNKYRHAKYRIDSFNRDFFYSFKEGKAGV